MPPPSTIPRFLLPRRSPLWSLSTKTTIRNASSKSKNNTSKQSGKPLVLEKPTKFNPPSHPARIRKDPPRYPGPQLSAEEIARQSGTLSTLAGGVWITNFKRDSPFGDMLPEWQLLFLHPIAFTRTCYEVLQLHTAHVTAETMERRKHKVEDVAKRAAYRKAHGLDKDQGYQVGR
ncbi:hypothetical protein SS1G_00988 [Sclerotinia sclerotiorum 1980 UF-70]|uniref:Uncharacterized protein n=1 Tax=Sclerotinia sclerotiorum (strain ATCC 18683 / 1980 / Ss-1) TaxID=665079 RepID=A7E6R3_SCLS1|nr:hypothetical protein SS1G_00988 [Sclerotinia sclerotiorum 1980 UF-70]EDN91585.1 hypothetical protein SS1G_00988 [Sclerotinia sclerotiorum 1980 UF-70]